MFNTEGVFDPSGLLHGLLFLQLLLSLPHLLLLLPLKGRHAVQPARQTHTKMLASTQGYTNQPHTHTHAYTRRRTHTLTHSNELSPPTHFLSQTHTITV